MAKAGPSTLVTTIGAATATLVVTTTILAWPTISDCSSEGADLAACLRDRFVGLPAEAPPRDDAWMAAHATETQLPSVPGVELTVEYAGTLKGAPAVITPQALDIELIPTKEVATIAVTRENPPPLVEISGAPSELGAKMVASSGVAASPVALGGSTGAIWAEGLDLKAAPSVAAEISPVLDGSLVASGPEPDVSSVEAVPIEAVGLPIALPLVADPVAPVAVTLTADSAPEPAPITEPDAPPPIIEFNPVFPNVIVLPSPVTGENSSIRTLLVD